MFMTFNKIKAMATSVEEIEKAISTSEKLQLSADRKRVSRIAEFTEGSEPNKSADERTIYVVRYLGGFLIEIQFKILIRIHNCHPSRKPFRPALPMNGCAKCSNNMVPLPMYPFLVFALRVKSKNLPLSNSRLMLPF